MSESKLKNSVLLRMVLVGALTLILIVPAILVESLVTERQNRRDTAVAEVSKGWGASQTLTGPILTIPYYVDTIIERGIVRSEKQYFHISPEQLYVASTINPVVRYRGIYEIALYNAHSSISGEFSLESLFQEKIPPEKILWDEALVTMGLSDLKGIKDTVNLLWAGTSVPARSGLRAERFLQRGITFSPKTGPDVHTYSFSLNLNLNGTSEFRVVPIGKETKVSMSSTWSDPNFLGSFLPDTREISSNGFKADWKILELNGSSQAVPAIAKNEENACGVRLMIPVDEYQKMMRTLKYAIMFIALTFLALFLSEVMTKTALHPIQYALIGLALVLFYVLLLSLSEHISFNLAYCCSGISIITLVGLYTKWITGNTRIMVSISSVLILLYSFFFVTLQLQDYALLLGSIGLVCILMCVMYLTRKVDWFELRTEESSIRS